MSQNLQMSMSKSKEQILERLLNMKHYVKIKHLKYRDVSNLYGW